ncbi:MAG: rhomboid family intramembrane serine protease [Gammaproteobacteria bacterium]|nr:rhomboid family intramembrane serine protease [Gammaproteobacteria bacterium]
MIPLHDDNPTSIKPIVTIVFIVVCCLVYYWESTLGTHLQLAMYQLGVVPSILLGTQSLPAELDGIPAWMTMFTSMFMHGGLMHLLGNMLYLWIFGNNIEDCMGHVRFVLFYLLCGIAAVFAQVIPNPESTIPMVGASGAISGVLGAYLLLYPHARVLVMIPFGIMSRTIRVSALYVLAMWFGIQLVSSIGSDSSQGGVAFGAHIGGFIAGMVLIPYFRDKRFALHYPWGRR